MNTRYMEVYNKMKRKQRGVVTPIDIANKFDISRERARQLLVKLESKGLAIKLNHPHPVGSRQLIKPT